MPTIKEQDEKSNATERQPVGAVSRRVEEPVEEPFAIRPPKKKKRLYKGVKKPAVNDIGF